MNRYIIWKEWNHINWWLEYQPLDEKDLGTSITKYLRNISLSLCGRPLYIRFVPVVVLYLVETNKGRNKHFMMRFVCQLWRVKTCKRYNKSCSCNKRLFPINQSILGTTSITNISATYTTDIWYGHNLTCTIQRGAWLWYLFIGVDWFEIEKTRKEKRKTFIFVLTWSIYALDIYPVLTSITCCNWWFKI